MGATGAIGPEYDCAVGRTPWVFLAATLGLMLVVVLGLKAGQSRGVPLLVDDGTATPRLATFEATVRLIAVKDGHFIPPVGVAEPVRFGWIYMTDGHVLRTRDRALLASVEPGRRYRFTCEGPAEAQVAKLCAVEPCGGADAGHTRR